MTCLNILNGEVGPSAPDTSNRAAGVPTAADERRSNIRSLPMRGEAGLGGAATSNDWQRQFSLLNDLPAIVYLRAPNYAVHYANRHFQERFGPPGSQPCYRLIHNRSTPCASCACATAKAQGQVQESEWSFADGSIYQLFSYPFVDVDGIEKVLYLGIDITNRRRAEIELERANRELQALSQTEHEERLLAEGLAQAALALNRSLDSTAVLDQIVEQALRVASCTSAGVLLIENEQMRLVRSRALDWWPAGDLERYEAGVPLHTSPRVEEAFGEHRAFLIPDISRDPQASQIAPLAGVGSLALVPMIQENHVAGFIFLLSQRRGAFTRETILRFASFASHAALAIGNSRLYQATRESRMQLQSLSRRLVEVQEQERRYVARELHDEAGQALTSLMIRLKLLQRCASEPDRVRTGLSELMGEVESVMRNLHGLAMDLRPASLDRLGLIAALRQHCQALTEQHEIQVTFDVVGLEERLAPDVETGLYRIVQEALNNVIRHAQATRVGVLLERRGDRIAATVEDNGRGLDPALAYGTDQMGLVGMEERAVALGGRLTIESAPEGGTTLLVEVPDAHPSAHCR